LKEGSIFLLQPRQALITALFLSLAILVIELTGGLVFHSAALVADALHIVTDILAVTFSLVALTISSRPPTGSLTYGYHRYEVVAGLVNGLSLFGVAGVIIYEAYLRFLHPQPPEVLGTILFAAIAVGLNVLSSRTLQNAQAEVKDSHNEDLNIHSARIHVFGDALASLAVIVGASLVGLTGLSYFDPLVAVLIGLVVIRSALGIARQGGAIILERSPFGDMPYLQERLSDVTGVADVHDLHVWRICSHITVASMHACLNAEGLSQPTAVRSNLVQEMDKLGIEHVTIQLEEVCCTPRHAHL
jgi:cobalt-zinc-cadmium efflux system protein